MCGCARVDQSNARDEGDADVVLRVDDMTCGHCAGTIEKAITSALPGTIVAANPGTKLVAVRGSRDLAALKAILSGVGYTAKTA